MRLGLFGLLVIVPFASCLCGGAQDERQPCEVTTDCAGEETCVDVPSGRVCAVVCGANTPCPSGSACVDEGGVLTCRELSDDRQVGQRCDNDRQCVTGACVGPNDDGESFCAAQCTADSGCPEGEFCFLADYRRVCLAPLTPALEAGADCPRGPRECASHACVKIRETDETGVCVDECDASVGCTGARNCVTIPDGADVCIDYVPDGTACDTALICEHLRCVTDDDDSQLCTRACANDDACADGWVCVPSTDDDDVCMPLRANAGAAGATCESKRDCLSGFCAGFDDGTTNHGSLCADPCNPDGSCDDTALVCWELDPPNPDLCGPFPTQP